MISLRPRGSGLAARGTRLGDRDALAEKARAVRRRQTGLGLIAQVPDEIVPAHAPDAAGGVE